MAEYSGSAQKMSDTGAVILSDSVVPSAGELLDDGFDRTTKVVPLPSIASLPIPANWTSDQWAEFIVDEQEAGKPDGVIYLELVRVIQDGTPGA